jgi:Na+-transporting NADH:ubiquinone oxidoreductase subunit A
MVAIKIKKGLDIPIKGLPHGEIQPLILSGDAAPFTKPRKVALDLSDFTHHRFKLLKKEGDTVKIGEPLVQDKRAEGIVFVSPGAGVITEITRGEKRSLLNMVISLADKEEAVPFSPIDPNHATSTEINERLKALGGYSHIHRRPFDLLATPDKLPRSLFVKAIETAPFIPPAELQVAGHESLFQAGLDALKKLTNAPIHLVMKAGSSCPAFLNAKNVELHTAEGPHPAGTFSVHIEQIDPITHPDDIVWTLNVHDVLSIGSIVARGTPFLDRVIGIGGPAALADRTGYFKVREGFPIEALVSGRLAPAEGVRLISGDPLTGRTVTSQGYLGFNAYAVVILEESQEREALHFFRLGGDKFTFSKAYASGHLPAPESGYRFTTSSHGEARPFIESALYDKVQPLPIPTTLLVKAVMAEDYDLAEELGLLEVVPEDFALSTFVCPSKIDMTEIIRNGQAALSEQVLH